MVKARTSPLSRSLKPITPILSTILEPLI